MPLPYNCTMSWLTSSPTFLLIPTCLNKDDKQNQRWCSHFNSLTFSSKQMRLKWYAISYHSNHVTPQNTNTHVFVTFLTNIPNQWFYTNLQFDNTINLQTLAPSKDWNSVAQGVYLSNHSILICALVFDEQSTVK
jgi:hypothetical protein